MEHPDVPEVPHPLKGARFPAGKDRLVGSARGAGAPEEVVRALRAVPQEEYTSPRDVARSVRTDRESELERTTTRGAEQAREGSRRGLSRHLRSVPRTPIREELDEG
ncbi:DUF2795 domain-containing protein [Streptomyces sp. NPDC006622]|uniref:DUF2795 domain-containing protein n=1 Tax=Streptomyces sp. NPDC006622 TaxID=3155459 RepID=UPI0033B3079C